jgi:hypothetical protein
MIDQHSIIDRMQFSRFVSGYSIFDGTVGFYGDRYAFILVEYTRSPHRDPLPMTRVLFVRMERPIERRFYHMTFDNLGFTRIGYHEAAIQEFVAVDTSGAVMSYRDGQAGLEARIQSVLASKEYVSVYSQVIRAECSLYALGWPRRIMKREGSGWHEFSRGIPVSSEILDGKDLTECTFHGLSAFTERDMYAVGGEGEVWRFDGARWHQCGFPSNELLFNVCCAADGNVYIGGNNGSLWVGRGDKWKRLAADDFSVSWKDLAFFAGKLWLGSDYGLWELRDGAIIRAEVPEDVLACSGALDVSVDGTVLLTAGGNGACRFDGHAWEVLFDTRAFGESYGRPIGQSDDDDDDDDDSDTEDDTAD